MPHRLSGTKITIRPVKLPFEPESAREAVLGAHVDPNDCIGVYVEDMAECLAAVISDDNVLLWSDADGAGTPIALGDDFVGCVNTVIDLVCSGEPIA